MSFLVAGLRSGLADPLALASFCVVNDVSSRGLCVKGGQWGVGKSFDGELRSLAFSKARAHRTSRMPRARDRLVSNWT